MTVRVKRFKVGIDSYGLEPLELEPMAVLDWATEHSAEGVQFSGIDPRFRDRVDRAYLTDMREFAAEKGLYLEWGGASHIPRSMNRWEKVELFETNRRAA